jgi:hypothetical protein
MIDLKADFDKLGKEGVELYRNSLKNSRRVATGKTNASIRFEAKADTLTFYALDHIRNIETGQTPSEVEEDQKKAGFFQKIEEWVKARNIKRSAQSIINGLLEKGWEGTDGVITDIDDVIKGRAYEIIKKGVKSSIIYSMKATKGK